ncbi:MAG TPA: hypothetical protein VKA46_41115 [Gemmataceae bacterium]|nr:hypothetical protein [Gemmataceae bacterium]
MAKAKGNGESVSGYFRRVFAENPKLLQGRSNQVLLDRWLKDHPHETEVPQKVRANLSNVKSLLRQEARKGGRPKQTAATSEPTGAQMAEHSAPKQTAATNDAPTSPLEQLEEQIDDCLALAKSLDRDRLSHVISMLRHARNLVVWEQGK